MRYEQIALNGPNSVLAPEALLKAAGHYELDDQLLAAADAYARVRVRYAVSPQALAAAYAESRCRYIQALEHPKDEGLTQQALATIAAIFQQFPRIAERTEIEGWRTELREKLEEDAYQQAFFYDSVRKQPKAALVAYRHFIQQHPGSARVPEVRVRIHQLEEQQGAEKK